MRAICYPVGFYHFDAIKMILLPFLPLLLRTFPQTETTPGHNKPNQDLSSERLQRDAALPADIFE